MAAIAESTVQLIYNIIEESGTDGILFGQLKTKSEYSEATVRIAISTLLHRDKIRSVPAPHRDIMFGNVYGMGRKKYIIK